MARKYKKRTNPRKATGEDMVVADNLVIAHMKPDAAVAGFKAQAKSWHRASLGMVSSGAVCMIVGAYTPNGNRVEYDQMILRLKSEVAESGIKQAQIYKYIGLSRGLVDYLFREAKVDGPVIQAVLAAKDHDTAMDAVASWLDKQKVRSLDDIGVLVGRYKRSGGDSPGATSSGGGGASGGDGDGAVTPTRATPEAIGERIKTDPEVLNTVNATDLVKSYMQAGHTPSELIEALIPHIDSARECGKLITKLTHKLERLRSGLTVVEGGKRRTA